MPIDLPPTLRLLLTNIPLLWVDNTNTTLLLALLILAIALILALLTIRIAQLTQANRQLAAKITQLKHTEQAHQESETRFRELAETVREGFFVYEIENARYSYVNPAYHAIIGTTAKFLDQGMSHWLNGIHPDDLLRIEQALKQEGKGENFDQEYRFIRSDGEIRWLQSKAFPIFDSSGTIVRIVGTVGDITDRKLAEAALRQSEERFKRAFDNAPIGMALISINGKFLKVNRSLCEILKYSSTELINRNLQDITYPKDFQECVNSIEQISADQIQIFQAEKLLLQKKGTTVVCSLLISLVKESNQQPLYCVVQIQDISDRLKIERLKNEFISIISHELRTPLTSIRGALGLLGSGVYDNRPEKAKHILKIAINSSERLVRLVNDILKLEQLKSDKLQPIIEECQVADLMQQAVDSVQALAEQSNITISLTTLAITMWLTPDAIVQAFINLLSNAIKFSSPGDTVWLKAEAGEQGGDNLANCSTPYILFSVKDQGRGIPTDKLEIIFEEFQQVDISDSRKKGGTGLGLAICKKIVQQHGGKIWVESILGEGSTFYFTLPIKTKKEND
jgi:PAS domain S-box-containing protein